MSERTDERSEDASVEDVLDDFGGDVGSGADDLDDGDVGFSDDELGVDVESLTGEPDASSGGSAGGATASESESSLLSRLTPSLPSLPNPLAALPSGRSVLLTFAVVLVMWGVASSIPIIGFIPLLWAGAIFAGAFTLGAASGKGRYVEFLLAGAVFGAGSVMTDFFRLAVLADIGLFPLAAIGGGIGAVAGLLGHYFGRDFRDGLTRDIE
jgi:hypothetical protein